MVAAETDEVSAPCSRRCSNWLEDFVVPGPGYGEPTIIRSPNPAMRDYLSQLATAHRERARETVARFLNAQRLRDDRVN